MKLVNTEDAVGHVLCHDLTQIIKDVKKDAVFRKGHVVTKEDIPVLLSMGKEHLYIWENQEGMLHENDAARELCQLCQGQNMTVSEVKEGKIDLFAACDGLLKANVEKQRKINELGEIIIASRHGNFPVKAGDKLAGTRVVPLVIQKDKLVKAREIAGGEPLFHILPIKPKRAGIITTGSEVLKGLVKDEFTPVLEEKLKEYGTQVVSHVLAGDDGEKITQHILSMIENQGADLILCTGGMSVDPDDRTPLAIKNTSAQVVSYGAPVLPGAMFMLAYYREKVPIVGLPGCVMYARRTIFDLILPRLLADDLVTRAELASLGQGGLCLSCDNCTFPNCGFGKV